MQNTTPVCDTFCYRVVYSLIMGDYSQDCIDSGFDEMATNPFWNTYRTVNVTREEKTDYNNESNIEDSSVFTHTVLGYKKIIKETEKSYVLEMSGCAKQHFSKKYCKLEHCKNYDEPIVVAPKWLLMKIAGI